MPLKIVSRPGTPILYLRGTVKGIRVHESTKTSNRARAEGIRIQRESEIWNSGEAGGRKGNTFSDAVISYLEFEPRSASTKTYITRLHGVFGQTELAKITQAAADEACKKILRPGAAAATKIRAVYAPLSAVLTHAAHRGMCNVPLFSKPRVKASKRAFLTPAQVSALVQAAPAYAQPLFIFLFGTGCRLSEALELDWSKVDLRGARATVWQKQGNERRIDLPPCVVAALAALEHRDGAVFRWSRMAKKGGSTVVGAYRDKSRERGGRISAVWANSCRRAGLPGEVRTWRTKAGQVMESFSPVATPHTARHTWASWHYALHKNTLALKADGGWSTVSMVEKYAKVMPDAYVPEIAAWFAGAPVEVAAELQEKMA